MLLQADDKLLASKRGQRSRREGQDGGIVSYAEGVAGGGIRQADHTEVEGTFAAGRIIDSSKGRMKHLIKGGVRPGTRRDGDKAGMTVFPHAKKEADVVERAGALDDAEVAVLVLLIVLAARVADRCWIA